MSACGLDFGTSNTTVGVWRDGPELVRLEGAEVTIPSAIFFPPGGDATIGRAAMAAYTDGHPGRLLRGLKSVLGKPLVDETTPVGRGRISFRDVIGRYLRAVKTRAEEAAVCRLDQVVHGRPVHFVDGDPDGDRRAEATLRTIAAAAGFADVSFEFEPIAAAFDHERALDREEIALIADIGGGTSDFSIVRLGPDRRGRDDRSGDILANDGVRIGGTDFDRLLSLDHVLPAFGHRSPMLRAGLDVPSAYFHDLATWSSINRLYGPKVRREIEEVKRAAARPDLLDRLLALVSGERGHELAMAVERAKIELSDAPAATIPLGFVEAGLSLAVGPRDLVGSTAGLTTRLRARAEACLRLAGLGPDEVDALVLTGGSTCLPHARAALVAALPSARVVVGDTFGSVGIGLTMEARRRYGDAA